MNLLLSNGKEKTFAHVSAVAQMNRRIAGQFGLDAEICMASGLLHDISAILRPADMLSTARGNGLELDEAERRFPFLLHQRFAKFLSTELFHIEDIRILTAIECHTTLKAHPTPYDMALFVADKLSWDQPGQPPYFIVVSRALEHSLEETSLVYMRYILDHNMMLHPHGWFTEGKRWLEETLADGCRNRSEGELR